MIDDDDITSDEMVGRMMSELDAWIVEIELDSSDYDARMKVLLSGAAPKVVDMDTAVRVEDAIYLPELGGEWTENMEFSVPSQTHAVKTLRSAITSGALGVERPNSKKQFLTRNLIAEWRETCREKPNLPISSSATPAAMPSLVKSRTKPNGAFTTDERELTRDAAKMTLRALKRR